MYAYIPSLGIFAMTLSPLYVPAAVTVAHWFKGR
jgi:hypothetical protein